MGKISPNEPELGRIGGSDRFRRGILGEFGVLKTAKRAETGKPLF